MWLRLVRADSRALVLSLLQGQPLILEHFIQQAAAVEVEQETEALDMDLEAVAAVEMITLPLVETTHLDILEEWGTP
jgi:hypothetical protein